jgi:hypothetical protein
MLSMRRVTAGDGEHSVDCCLLGNYLNKKFYKSVLYRPTFINETVVLP